MACILIAHFHSGDVNNQSRLYGIVRHKSAIQEPHHEVLRQFEFGLSPVALLLTLVYHVHLYRKMRSDPLSTALGLARRTRALWVQTIMKGGKDILPVQTLRNWTMAATFLASAAILIGPGIRLLVPTITHTMCHIADRHHHNASSSRRVFFPFA